MTGALFVFLGPPFAARCGFGGRAYDDGSDGPPRKAGPTGEEEGREKRAED